VVEQRLLDRLADRLEAGEMDHRFDRCLREDALERVRVAQIGLVERHRSRGRNLAQAVEHHALGIDKAVDDHERVPRAREGEAAVRADVAEPAGDEDGWHVQILPTAKKKPRRGGVSERPGFGGRGRLRWEGAQPEAHSTPARLQRVSRHLVRGEPFVNYYTRKTPGSQSASAGNAMSRPTSTRSATRKGSVP